MNDPVVRKTSALRAEHAAALPFPPKKEDEASLSPDEAVHRLEYEKASTAFDHKADVFGRCTISVQRRGYILAKRIFDVISASCLLLVIWPIMLLIIVLIKLDSKGPAIYCHKRVGKNHRPIRLYKFRTMVVGADEMVSRFTSEQRDEWEKNYKLVNDLRITKIGKSLRRTSLDELPQLFNIIMGQLSVVGPRPVVENELLKYGNNADKFLSITPGLTGYWQAYARSDCSYEQRIEMELSYIDNSSFIFDMKILFKTLKRVIAGKGAY